MDSLQKWVQKHTQTKWCAHFGWFTGPAPAPGRFIFELDYRLKNIYWEGRALYGESGAHSPSLRPWAHLFPALYRMGNFMSGFLWTSRFLIGSWLWNADHWLLFPVILILSFKNRIKIKEENWQHQKLKYFTVTLSPGMYIFLSFQDKVGLSWSKTASSSRWPI